MTIGTLKEGEPHPQAHNALAFVKEWIVAEGVQRVMMLQESMASCAIEGNRSGEVCGETLSRILHGQPVSDRYVLGLAWFLHEMDLQTKN